MLNLLGIALDLLSWQTLCTVCHKAVLSRKACEGQSQSLFSFAILYTVVSHVWVTEVCKADDVLHHEC